MKKIDSFFKPKKRTFTEENTVDKAQKLSDKENKSHDSPALHIGKPLQDFDELEISIPETEGMGSSWKKALVHEFSRPYFKEVKVVIIGQDPYHGPNQAHGLCFSVPVNVAIPPSLENIYKELSTDIPEFKHPGHGYLLGWAQQGVLLLNSCLTVESGKPNSHQGKGWEKFTDAVISWIASQLSNVVFLLWGSYAQKKCSFIDTSKHLILKSVHPSPLSVYRGFFGCKHFSKTNLYLTNNGKNPIDWNKLFMS